MFDLDLSKLAVIGLVALVVIGPEKLPHVARMIGTILGRAQRYVNDIKAEVSREMEFDELRNVKTEFEQAARNVENKIHDTMRRHESDIKGVLGLDHKATDDNTASGSYEDTAGVGGARADGVPWRPATPPVKRKNWRTKQAALPSWYKRVSVTRSRVQSGAARVARHRPASLRRPSRFF